jgi:hypothetical protein
MSCVCRSDEIEVDELALDRFFGGRGGTGERIPGPSVEVKGAADPVKSTSDSWKRPTTPSQNPYERMDTLSNGEGRPWLINRTKAICKVDPVLFLCSHYRAQDKKSKSDLSMSPAQPSLSFLSWWVILPAEIGQPAQPSPASQPPKTTKAPIDIEIIHIRRMKE